jgi:putative endonuclease
MKSINKIIGDFGEDLAVQYLSKKGYAILDRNTKISYGEIDIVAKINDTIVFVEVKTRTTNTSGSADDSLTRKQINNLKKTLNLYLYSKHYSRDKARLDLLVIDIDKNKKIARIKHYRDIY